MRPRTGERKKQPKRNKSSDGEFEEMEPEDIDERGQDRQKGRQENSLAVLTKKFVQMIKASQDLTIDLNQAAEKLSVQKRRIYDITNVLEGIHYVEKRHKNTIKWIGKSSEEQEDREILRIRKQMEDLAAEERRLDRQIQQLTFQTSDLLGNPMNHPLMYITFDDCLKIYKSMLKDYPERKEFIIINAPAGSKIELASEEDDVSTLTVQTQYLSRLKVYRCDLQNGVYQHKTSQRTN